MAGIDSYVKVMLHCNGADGSNTFTDSSPSPKTMTAYNDAQIDTGNSVFGGASGQFDGVGDYVSTPNSADFNFGTGNFTIDFWLCLDWTRKDNDRVISTRTIGADSGWASTIFWASATVVYCKFFYAGISSISTGTNDYPNGTWVHTAIVRNGTNLSIYINGVAKASITISAGQAINSDGGGFVLGRYYTDHAWDGKSLKGWIDELRISKGIARWTENFSVPTEEYYAAIEEEVTDSLSLDDSFVSAYSVGNLAEAEGLSLDDVLTLERLIDRSFNESLSMGEVFTVDDFEKGLPESFEMDDSTMIVQTLWNTDDNESIGLGDSFDSLLDSLPESFSVDDQFELGILYDDSLFDSVRMSNTIDVIRDIYPSLVESLSLDDVMSCGDNYEASESESFSVSEIIDCAHEIHIAVVAVAPMCTLEARMGFGFSGIAPMPALYGKIVNGELVSFNATAPKMSIESSILMGHLITTEVTVPMPTMTGSIRIEGALTFDVVAPMQTFHGVIKSGDFDEYILQYVRE